MKFYPPLMVLTGIIIQLIIAYFAPVEPLMAPVFQYVGVAMMFICFVGVVLMARKFSRTETTILPDGKPQVLMEDGLFAYSRNPIYVAMALVLLGSGLASGQIWSLLVVPIFVLLVQQMWIVREEENLEAAFGQIYRNYKMRVRRWL